ncbi:hypothetical protein AB4571_01190 [Vibrio breoganii]
MQLGINALDRLHLLLGSYERTAEVLTEKSGALVSPGLVDGELRKVQSIFCDTAERVFKDCPRPSCEYTRSTVKDAQLFPVYCPVSIDDESNHELYSPYLRLSVSTGEVSMQLGESVYSPLGATPILGQDSISFLIPPEATPLLVLHNFEEAFRYWQWVWLCLEVNEDSLEVRVKPGLNGERIFAAINYFGMLVFDWFTEHAPQVQPTFLAWAELMHCEFMGKGETFQDYVIRLSVMNGLYDIYMPPHIVHPIEIASAAEAMWQKMVDDGVSVPEHELSMLMMSSGGMDLFSEYKLPKLKMRKVTIAKRVISKVGQVLTLMSERPSR